MTALCAGRLPEDDGFPHLSAGRYDSFVVRVWRHPGHSDFMRAEVRHVQSGTAETSFDCTSEWIGERIRERVAEEEFS